MNFEPQKFFVGLIDFFSILLPGAVLTYLLREFVGPVVLGNKYYLLQDTEAATIFLFVSYLLGQFLFLIGSQMDPWVYDPLRKMTDAGQYQRLAEGKQLSPPILRRLASWCFGGSADAAVERVVPIKEGYLKRIRAPGAVNAFQWCKARLAMEQPEALAVVNRFEADSKFFRSFIPVLLGICVMTPFQAQWPLETKFIVLLGSLVLLGLAFWRYLEQRFKSTQQAYWFILTLEAGQQPPSSAKPSGLLPMAFVKWLPWSPEERGHRTTHAGGVVFRKREYQVQYLLVQSTNDPKEWVLPKGHIEPGEPMEKAVVREVREETGIWARITSDLGEVNYKIKQESVRVQFYLMETVEEGNPNEGRQKVWLPIVQAIAQATHDESKDLLTRIARCPTMRNPGV